ncbi:MAG: hypothetical protein P8Y92_01910 [Halioglobus sp.]
MSVEAPESKPLESELGEGESGRRIQDFSLVSGGPFYRFLRRLHLCDDASELLSSRVIVISLFAWLPMLILALVQGNLLGDDVSIPFLLDFKVHARFLVAMPLLLAAEVLVQQRMSDVVDQFPARNLVPEASVAQFESAISSVSRLRDAAFVEASLFALVYSLDMFVIWRGYLAPEVTTWYATTSALGTELSPAGMWYFFIGLPLLQFLFLRWYYRLFLWARFLWQVSRIRLNLLATHPDRVAGLGFLSNTVNALITLALAHGALLAGHIADLVLYRGAELRQFGPEIVAVVVLVQCIVFMPLLVFAGQIMRTRWRGLMQYEALSSRYAYEFESTWLRGGVSPGQTLVGNGDLQSLADLDSGYQIVRGMGLVPVSWRAVLLLAVATLIPIAPLLLTVMPFRELLGKVAGILF